MGWVRYYIVNIFTVIDIILTIIAGFFSFGSVEGVNNLEGATSF